MPGGNTSVPEPPSPLVPLSTSFSPANTPRREASFFNPLFGTPHLTPGPGNEVSAVPAGARPGPWVVSPPPPSGRNVQEKVGFFSSPGGWFQQTLQRQGLLSTVLAVGIGVILFFVVLGAYVVLTYLAVTTKKTKYIIFLSVLAALMCLILYNLYAGQQPVNPNNRPSRFMTEQEENEAIRRAYGKEEPA